MLNKYTKAKARANKKWDDKNKARKTYLSRRSGAKGFILKLATEDDLQKIEEYISQRRDILKQTQK